MGVFLVGVLGLSNVGVVLGVKLIFLIYEFVVYFIVVF